MRLSYLLGWVALGFAGCAPMPNAPVANLVPSSVGSSSCKFDTSKPGMIVIDIQNTSKTVGAPATVTSVTWTNVPGKVPLQTGPIAPNSPLKSPLTAQIPDGCGGPNCSAIIKTNDPLTGSPDPTVQSNETTCIARVG